jgi:hypothetical protein
MSNIEAWVTLLALGAFHGINPGMGWLFAVALGLQEKRRRAVYEALIPIALGHAISIGAVVLVVAVLKDVTPMEWLRWPVGVGLIAFGAYKFFRSRHPRWVGMRVNFRDLVTWSFLMASAHGAGLMLVPVLLGWSAGLDAAAAGHGGHGGHEGMQHHTMDHGGGGGHAGHAGHIASVASTPLLGLLATGVHTLGYLAVMGIVAVIIYEKVGLAILRTAWFNLDIIWALALVVAGAVTLLV